MLNVNICIVFSFHFIKDVFQRAQVLFFFLFVWYNFHMMKLFLIN